MAKNPKEKYISAFNWSASIRKKFMQQPDKQQEKQTNKNYLQFVLFIYYFGLVWWSGSQFPKEEHIINFYSFHSGESHSVSRSFDTKLFNLLHSICFILWVFVLSHLHCVRANAFGSIVWECFGIRWYVDYAIRGIHSAVWLGWIGYKNRMKCFVLVDRSMFFHRESFVFLCTSQKISEKTITTTSTQVVAQIHCANARLHYVQLFF